MALVLVTGASTGLGLATVRQLADAGHDVVLHARNPGRLTDQGIRDRVRDLAYADLGELDQTVRLAEQINGIGQFDAVIHNAGVIDGPSVFAVNIVARYVLTALLTPPRRTIVLSSSTHLTGSPDLDQVDLSMAAIVCALPLVLPLVYFMMKRLSK